MKEKFQLSKIIEYLFPLKYPFKIDNAHLVDVNVIKFRDSQSKN